MKANPLFNVPVTGLQKGKGGEWVVSGPVSTGSKDLENEILESSGVWEGLKTFQRLGMQVDWDHQYPRTKDNKWLVGRGVKIEKKNGVPHLSTSLYPDNPLAEKAVEILNHGGKLFYSVYGPPPRRKGNRVIECPITMVSLTPWAVNPECAVELQSPVEFAKSLIKSLLAGSGSSWESTGGRTLAREDVEGHPVVTTAHPGPSRKRRRKKTGCTGCGRRIPGDSLLCPFCGVTQRRR